MARATTSTRPIRSVQVYEKLRAAVLKGELAPGQRLVTREIAQQFGVSDIPVREAFWMLARDGLVDMSPYSGARVASLTRDEILEVLHIRSMLEGHATELATPRMDEASLAELREILAAQEAVVNSPAPDALEYSALNRRFHTVIFDQCGNRKLVELIAHVWTGHSNLQTVFRRFPDRLRQSLDEHRAIYRALADGDAKRAGELAAEHKRLQQQDLLATLDSDESESVELRERPGAL